MREAGSEMQVLGPSCRHSRYARPPIGIGLFDDSGRPRLRRGVCPEYVALDEGWGLNLLFLTRVPFQEARARAH